MLRTHADIYLLIHLFMYLFIPYIYIYPYLIPYHAAFRPFRPWLPLRNCQGPFHRQGIEVGEEELHVTWGFFIG